MKSLFNKKIAAVLISGALLLPVAASTEQAVGKGKPRYIDLNKVAKPKITGAEIITGLEELVSKYPLRQNMLPNNEATAAFLAEEAKGYGFKVRTLEYEVGTPARTVRVVEAIKKGTKKPNEWIAFVAHYDIIASAGFTIQGAYDDGTGTNILRYFGQAFSKIKTDRSIALLWFDAEENGLLASQAYTEELAARGQKVHAALGFDMVGIGHPAPYCICIYHGTNIAMDPAIAVPIIDYVNFDFLEFPKGDGGTGAATKIGSEGHVCNCGPNVRNSDESNFAEQGYFTMRWTGMKTAADYPGYHQPWDTVPFMEAVARSRENLELGTENTFMSAYYTAMLLDKYNY